ncbi:MAG: zf-TFIIB domain-containing protein [Lentisphaeraceae bacterium]|nr:zf-TFIIB domain-containing protein [Lentisphaeraceae bacterium]
MNCLRCEDYTLCIHQLEEGLSVYKCMLCEGVWIKAQ